MPHGSVGKVFALKPDSDPSLPPPAKLKAAATDSPGTRRGLVGLDGG